MFEHSVPVPRLYKTAAKIVDNVNKTGDSVKNLVYQTKHTNTKALFALVVETLKHTKQINFLLKRIKLFEKEPRFNPCLARVLINELIWGKKNLPGESKPIKTILAYQQVLNAYVPDVHQNVSRDNKVTKPRFVRVNTIQTSVDDVLLGFRDEGWTFVRHMETKDYDGFLHKVANLSENEFMVDIHIPELLIFPPDTEFHRHHAYKNGLIVLQDKASCLPAYLLNPPAGSVVLDMCAAPGMKTSQLAGKLNNDGKIYAVDLDMKRLKTLEALMATTGVTCVKAINKDVLKITNNDCPDVKYILVDPSCSGSGIVDRLDFFGSIAKDETRIQKLKGFQIMILKHALRKFPKAERVVYSTCSIYPEENEEVVKEVLSQNAFFKLVNARDLLKGSWCNFGSEKYGDIGKSCLYSLPEKDFTNGFFVAVFDRLRYDEVNEYFVQNSEFQGNKHFTKNSRYENEENSHDKDENDPEEINDYNNDDHLCYVSNKNQYGETKNSKPETYSEDMVPDESKQSKPKKRKKKDRNKRNATEDDHSLENTDESPYNKDDNFTKKTKKKAHESNDNTNIDILSISVENASNDLESKVSKKTKRKRSQIENTDPKGIIEKQQCNIDLNDNSNENYKICGNSKSKKKKRKEIEEDTTSCENNEIITMGVNKTKVFCKRKQKKGDTEEENTLIIERNKEKKSKYRRDQDRQVRMDEDISSNLKRKKKKKCNRRDDCMEKIKNSSLDTLHDS